MTDKNSILDQFIIQSNTQDLKYAHYPKKYNDLDMKISFGMGVPARIPWIAFIGNEMLVSNGFYPVYLYYKDLKMLILSYGISETSEYEQSWPDSIISNKTKIKDFFEDNSKVHRYGSSFVHRAYTIDVKGNNVEYKLYENDKILTQNELINDLDEIIHEYKNSINIEIKNEDSLISQGKFYMEKHLEEFIITNWNEIDLGSRYDLIYDEGELVSQQFRTDIGFIDILAKDKKDGSYVVIELKKNQTSDDTIGQIARYMGWIRDHKKDEDVKGIIIASEFTKKLKYAIKYVKNIDVLSYEINFSLNEVKR